MVTVEEYTKAKARLCGSLLDFTRQFYEYRTGRKYLISTPPSRESHYVTIIRELVRVKYGQTRNLLINVPPRYGKTELLIHFVAWCLGLYPDCNFIYVSYAHSLAKKQTQTIKEIMALPMYQRIFGVGIKEDTSAKDNFETTAGGMVFAAGAGGPLTGRGAGIKHCPRFGGAIIIDDIHKPIEATSDTVRESIKEWYHNTLLSRINDPKTPIIFIGQRLHEDDLPANLIKSGKFTQVILPAIDHVGNPLYPEMHDAAALREMEKLNPYVFAAQYQQNPQPAGGGVFKPEWFVLTEEEPEIIATFITADTAETDKDYNDATVFSFFGLYKIKQKGVETDVYGLHWLDCYMFRVEPKDLENEFMDFYARCMRHKVKPKLAGIEKKSTGVTLASILSKLQGLQIINIERTKASGNKAARFLEIQPYIASKVISLPIYGSHTQECIEHCRKITANNSHLHDDIADTLYDGIKLALIDKVVQAHSPANTHAKEALDEIYSHYRKLDNLREAAYGKNY